MNNHPHPRGGSVKDFIKLHKGREVNRKEVEFIDRKTCRMEDGYTDEQLTELCVAWLTCGSQFSIRTLADFMLGHSSLARGDFKRSLQYADMFATLLPGEGATECCALVVASRVSKTNKAGQVQYNAAIRSRDPARCTVGAVGLYLFLKWQGEGTTYSFPSFKSPRDWYNLYFLSASAPDRSMAYTTQAKHIKRALISVGIQSSKVTHITRGSAARHAEAAGVSEDQIRRTGHWNEDVLQRYYLSKLARETIRVLAGFAKEIGGYWIPRAAILPSESLQQAIFPEVDSLLLEVRSRDTPDRAAIAFLELLQFLRVVVLQDAAMLIDRFPGSSAWIHPIFASPEFLDFKVHVMTSEEVTLDPTETKLREVLPDLTRLIQTSFAQVSVQLGAMTSTIGALEQRMSAMELQMSGNGNATPLFAEMLQSDNPQAEVLPVGVPAAQEDRAVSPTPMHTPAPATPQYTLNRQLATVKAVWREFSTGLPGQPSVRHLENTYKSKWRVGEAENRFFRKRKELYRAVACIATARHILPLGAAKLLDEYAEAEDFTLDQLRIQITTATERLCLPTEKSE
ncbi:hypothetical protein BBJ28_00026159 [Nothophytophthora sp. Chile5]|nr:hypothetical protein BBJ28_00026159 [Nothophytophthora sp. Chile5]